MILNCMAEDGHQIISVRGNVERDPARDLRYKPDGLLASLALLRHPPKSVEQ